MKVFIDTSAWIALQIKEDKNHVRAKSFLNEVKKKRAILYTNDYVLDETITRLIYDVGLKIALIFREKINFGIENNLNLIEIDKKDRENAWKILEKYSDHKLSFTDATIAANAWEYNLDKVFTFDGQFRKIGLLTN